MAPAAHDWRSSRLTSPGPPSGAGEGPFTLLIGDLHNHSLHSDGRGNPEQAFAQMRRAGLDVAALTDHASIPPEQRASLGLHQYPDRSALAMARTGPRSFDPEAWERTGRLADQHDVPGEFTALRGFEWTEPWLGHVNVWFSDAYLPVTTPGDLGGLQDWLVTEEPAALFGYNHPGREPGRLADFALADDDSLPRRMVALEGFNRSEDFLFAGAAGGSGSPIVACLDAGWQPGLIGCSDEHGTSYGLAGKGRTGLWVREHSRAGVREALTARRTFATREVGLRLDATLGGVRMGARLRHGGGAVELVVDLAGSGYEGRTVELQLVTSGGAAGADGREVAVLARQRVQVGQVCRVPVDVPAAASWVLVRVADPARAYGGPAPRDHPCSCWAVAYSSPWYLGD